MNSSAGVPHTGEIELDTLTPIEGATWGGLLRAYATLTKALDADLRDKHELPLSWYDVLRQLARASDNSLRLSDLAARVLLTQSGLSRLVDRLEREELVCREPDPEDGRATRAVLTRKGAARLQEAHPTHVDGIRRYFLQYLDQEEMKVFADVWRRFGRVSDGADKSS